MKGEGNKGQWQGVADGCACMETVRQVEGIRSGWRWVTK